MANKKTIESAFLFPNGNLAVFNLKGEQVGHLQGPYSIEKHKEIFVSIKDHSQMRGFNILPIGFADTVRTFGLNCFKYNWSYKEATEF